MEISKEIIEVSKLQWFPEMMRELGYEPVKHGYWACRPLWKNEPLEYTTANYYRCSVCNHPAWAITDYCPHCGAKMDEVKYE